jgi:uncharacterized protein (DUF58 family)
MAHLTRVKARLAIHAHRKVRGLLEGEYAALQVGRGIDFMDLREYVRGDDVKDIDWKASARGRQLLVKRYIAERKHTVLLTVSTGRSMAAMNDADVSKRDLSVFVAGMIGYLATQHSDLVALVHGDAARQHARPPEGGELALERLLGTIHDATTVSSPPSDLASVLDYAKRAIRRRTIMVVISDDTTLSEETVTALRRLRAQHELLFVTIGDLDPTTPTRGRSGNGARRTGLLRRLVDIDTGREIPDWIRNDRQLHAQYTRLVTSEEQTLRKQLDRLGIVHERVHDWDTAIAAVFTLLERHRHARVR